MGELLWYIPNTVEAGIRGDDVASGWADLERSVTLARMAEDHGWGGALLGTSWGRPDTFTVATALAARTTTFKPLIAVRPGYWRPAHFGVPRLGGVHRLAAQRGGAVGQQRLIDLADRGEVLDSCLYTAPGRVGGGGAATTWLDFIISDAPYLRECARIGDEILPRLRLAPGLVGFLA
jgi:hypothetical protein